MKIDGILFAWILIKVIGLNTFNILLIVGVLI